MSTGTRIVETPDVLHGKPRIGGTRIGVLQIGTQIRQHGLSVDDVSAQFDLDSAQVEAALEYYDEHPELMEALRAQHRPASRHSKTRVELRDRCGFSPTISTIDFV